MDDEALASTEIEMSTKADNTLTAMEISTRPLRVAILGCGHGTLDAIYASVEKTCEVQNWDVVDLVIINGDFQAVRHHQDLNVTAMPAKYRQLADFHRYYYGGKVAPYLTIFIGGNHEASNHLFELFYGGWVAHNIYYLGAANVIKLGDLKIAGLSGIYHHRDYTKPHFERLPYSEGTMRSIYHQRDIDVRKLLAYRTQIDIGLSHDWPKSIESFGNHRKLFKFKRFLAEDAANGRLGSPAAASVMDRLRPPYWFSAHMHARFSALKTYDTVIDQGADQSLTSVSSCTRKATQSAEAANNSSSTKLTTLQVSPSSDSSSLPHRKMRPENAAALSGWTAFSETVQQQDRDDRDNDQRELEAQREERRRNGVQATVPYVFEETFKEVRINNVDGVLERQAVSSSSKLHNIPQYDGCCASTPSPLKRQRKSSDQEDDRVPVFQSQQTDGSASPAKTATTARITNPDAIDIDMSDSEEGDFVPTARKGDEFMQAPSNGETEHNERRRLLQASQVLAASDPFQVSEADPSNTIPVVASVTTSAVNPAVAPVQTHDSHHVLSFAENHPVSPPSISGVRIFDNPVAIVSSGGQDDSKIDETNLETHPGRSVQSNTNKPYSQPIVHDNEFPTDEVDTNYNTVETRGDTISADQSSRSNQQDQNNTTADVSDDVRNQLALLSSEFAPEDKIQVSPPLPFPSETITNKNVKFLALSKAESGQNFLQLIEMPDKLIDPSRPPKLEYDPEWLAITRVFSSELQLGGDPGEKPPTHRGDTYYRDRIIEEEAWVKENILKKGSLNVPENFTITSTGDHDPANLGVDPSMPREVTNPQTITFCKMLEIANPFDISEAERDERMAAGPPAEPAFNSSRGSRGQRGNWAGQRGGYNSGGYNGGGGGRGGRGHGRGRARGYGH